MNMADMIFGADIDDAPHNRALTLDDLMAAPAKPKQRIRYGSEEYYRWIGKVKDSCVKAAAFIKALVKEPEQQTACPCCHGSGEYIGASYRTRCARCKGKGYMTQADENAYRTWSHARDQGLPKVRTDLGAAFNLA